MMPIHRRLWFVIFAIVDCGLIWSPSGSAQAAEPQPQLLYTSQGKSARINVDGSGQQYFNFDVPNQATWQPGPIFPDGQRLIFLSMEPRRDGPGKPFEEYYTQTPTHLWVHDLASGDLQEICTKDRLAVFVTPALLLGDDRLLIQVVRDKVGQIFSVRMDGSDPREFTRAGEGMPYGLSLSPDGQRVAFHLASSDRISGLDLRHERPTTSADRRRSRLIFTSAQAGRPMASRCSMLTVTITRIPVTTGQTSASAKPMVRSTAFLQRARRCGSRQPTAIAETRGGGSNLPAWTHDGKILFPRRKPDSKVAWEYQPQRPDLDHFNRDYKPEAVTRRHRNLPARSARRIVRATNSQRTGRLGFSGHRIARRPVDRVLPRRHRRSAGVVGHGIRRQQSAATYPRLAGPRRGPPAVAFSRRHSTLNLLCETERCYFACTQASLNAACFMLLPPSTK